MDFEYLISYYGINDGPAPNVTESITYKELNTRANQLAIGLRNLGVGKNDVVAIHLDRNIEAIIAILGILKAGAAYLPIDLSLPKNKKKYIVLDSNVQVVISHEDYTDLFHDFKKDLKGT